MQQCPFCDKVYDESEYSHCPYCSGELEDDDEEFAMVLETYETLMSEDGLFE